jgi:acetyltransferase
MSIRNLDRIFKPRRVAVIGASETSGKVGYTVLHNLVGHGFDGVVYPVNSRRDAVQGIAAYPDVSKLPHPADLAIICTPAAAVPDLVRQCGRAGILGVVILSAGFREVGPAGLALEQLVKEAAAQTPGLRILGPNCLGLIVPGVSMNASFAAVTPKRGRIAFLSQSGALCTSVLDWALERDIGFSCFVSVGNMLDVGMSDLIDYFAADVHTESMILYIEALCEARQFMSAARAFARSKPIVVYKSGRFADSAKAAASHTGAMAGVDAVYEAAFERAGIVRVFEIDDVFDCAQLLARSQLPRGQRLAIVSNAGGPGVMATDCLIARHGQLAPLSSETMTRLNDFLPVCWSHGNPVDVLGDADPQRFAQALGIVLADAAVDAALAILTPQAMTDPTATAAAVASVASGSTKPVLAAWMGGRSVREGAERLEKANVPTYETPDHAVRAFLNLVSYAKNRELLYETPREIALALDGKRRPLNGILEKAHAAGQSIVSEVDSKAMLEAYGIPTVSAKIARTRERAIEAARALGFPVVLKILSPQITHKTDVGGVELNVADEHGVGRAFDRMVESVRRLQPQATIEGVTVEPMVTSIGGLEMIVGVKRDPIFGPVTLVGTGGIAAEVFQDRALGLPPLNDRLARRMLESLRSWPILQGFRGRPAMNIDRLIEILIRFSYLVADHAEILEFDINPLLVSSDQVQALDARAVLDLDAIGMPRRPFAHLAIRPYPEEFMRAAKLADGTEVLLRPIKPEDEPIWNRFHASCSAETVHARFHGLFAATHSIATRFCFPDYDREMTIVAEVEQAGQKTFLGMAQLMADPDHREAEFAVVVTDSWQGRGLGSLLTKTCVDVGRRWGVTRVTAETDLTNTRMLAVFRRQGFALEPVGETVHARKALAGATA